MKRAIAILVCLCCIAATPFIPHRRAAFRAGFSPTDISGLVVWYKADADVLEAAADPCEDADPVAIWNDQSGNGYHANVYDSVYRANRNGAPAVEVQETGPLTNIFPTVVVTDAAVTCFMVIESTDTRGMLVTEYDDFSTYVAAWRQSVSDSPHNNSGSPSYYTNNVVLSSPTQATLYDAFSVGATVVVTIEFNMSSYGNGFQFAGYKGVSSWPMSGYIREIILYNSTLSSGDRTSVYDYLAGRWL